MPHHHKHHARRHEKVEKRGKLKDSIIELIDNTGPAQDPEVSIIYVTAKPTFDGPIGGYSTQGQPAKSSDSGGVGPPVQITPSTKPETSAPTPTNKPTPKLTPTSQSTTHVPTSRPKAESTTPVVTSTPTSLDKIPTSTGSNDAVSLSTTASTPSPTAVPASGGMSTAAKAGTAIGILALIGLLIGAALLFLRRREKKKKEAEVDNEKSLPPAPTASAYSPPPQHETTSSVPPQLNIRPVTQLSLDLTGRAANSPTMVNVAGVVGARNLTGQQNGSQNIYAPKTADSTSSNPFNDPVNPFETRSGASTPTSTSGPAPQPLGMRTPSPEESNMRTPSPETVSSRGAAAGTAIAAGSAPIAAVAAGAAMNGHSGKPPSLQHVPGPPAGWLKDMPPPSPARSMDSVSVTSTTAAAISTGGSTQNNVHRIQLDFAPSMDDELELRAGQLVRLLHEYDDGWALCIRLDRSQQGVAPRTCLSARPVKPRPRNPPPGPGPRGPPPIGGPHGRMSPAGGRHSPGPRYPLNGPPRFAPQQNSRPASPGSGYRPYTAPNRAMSPVRFPEVPRSLSPAPGSGAPQPRSMSPGPYGAGEMEKPRMPETQRKRSNSAAGVIGPIPAPNLGPSALGASVQNTDAMDHSVVKTTEKPAEQPAEQPPQPMRSPPPSLGLVERKPVPGEAC
ncbi:hypothetical protein PRK78_000364 [Emydomyces testavorans]|uniref:SH3 domain-containing protein n=1 Tax=Emydomyces testavorans TaxID=2070801 RepID=A0AAF0DCC4_9EURO|nr:hypothetical protein PRK78_000364 [Emydomyces testavorans]